ncbi:O-antigen ligase family protein (plasmid) [Sphingomonadaceae bacterium OTU29LAMAA1]|nr:O-antigen ligase family protein [Sphingomonadaceae bacterium OTU29LAMAA1]
MAVLWLAGGASRGNAAGQIVVRAAAFLALIVMAMFGRRAPTVSARPIWGALVASIALAVLQLLPLPAGLAHLLPGRVAIGTPIGVEVRSWSIVPGATLNALFALVVPVAVLVLVTRLDERERGWLPWIVLVMTVASIFVGLLQFSGVAFDNPLINDSPGAVSGTFSNRNHFALFLALGCLAVPVCLFTQRHSLRWRGPVGLGLLLLFTLTILASGSRAGLIAGGLAIGIVALLSWHGVRRNLRGRPRWVFPAVVAAAASVFALFIVISLAAGRAVSIDRSLSVDIEQDMRSRALPTVWTMVRDTFPAGNGLGSFDSMFRRHEPETLLKPSWFNQAHNDIMDVALSAGLPGLLLLATALIWWVWASIGVWRNLADRQYQQARLGSAMVLLVVISSVFDYPARTPMMMAMIVFAGFWLSSRVKGNNVSTLPAPCL